MDLPDCPPGAEGYEDSVTEKPKKPEDSTCTKAEQEFQEHLSSLKVEVEDGSKRCMVERRGRDVSGKWIYLCFPCAVICSGETILQTHLSGKKHKHKLMGQTRPWPVNIFTEHPYILSEKGLANAKQNGVNEKMLQKMSQEANLHNKNMSDLDAKYSKYREMRCHIQDSLDAIKVPLIGVEYLIEHPPQESHHEPSYVCILCEKKGHPRTIVNHLISFMHRFSYIMRHFPKAHERLMPFRGQPQAREGVNVTINRLLTRIEGKYGRLKPVNIGLEEYEREKELIHQWIAKGEHISQKDGCTFEEVVDVDLINFFDTNDPKSQYNNDRSYDRRDPSPPVVAAPYFNQFHRSSTRQTRRAGSESLSDISDDAPFHPVRTHRGNLPPKIPYDSHSDRHHESPSRSRYPSNSAAEKKPRPQNYDHKLKLTMKVEEKLRESAKKMLSYHEKNPEKHPLYPEEWKKFWNRRYKEVQAEGKDPYKYDFKPEWIVYWTKRMKELHDEELKVQVHDAYRKMCLTPPDMSRKSSEPRPEARNRSLERRRRSPEQRKRSPDPRRRSPDTRRRSPDYQRRDRRSPDERRPSFRHSPDRRRSPGHSPGRRGRSPLRRVRRSRSRSPLSRRDAGAAPRNRSPARADFSAPHASNNALRSPPRRSRSPLSRRAAAPPRNRSPLAAHPLAPSMQTVLVSDDELNTDDISPWNSENDLESVESVRESTCSSRRTRSRRRSRGSRSRAPPAQPAPLDLGPAENVVATLRMLVALEDYLGSLGPKIVDLLTEALRMEKEKPNSSEELLDRETALVLMETAKEKLKGAAQAGLVSAAAAAAARAAVSRAAATLHAADTRARAREKKEIKSAPVPVAGIGEVDRAQIAQQMAAALIAQGKTDVSSEELAQLVDAVVGMAEAKKREAEKQPEPVPSAMKPSKPSPTLHSGTASALQMLQSAYDENDRKNEKVDVPDAMDGLSDSDLETLLKNFNELSAEEQHSLIAYLKKLEAREPQRVERLRQYVSAAASTAPVEEAPTQPDKQATKTVTIESDDDDYTVEEVFKSATQKVKENQIRQEMEIVKKSLEETKEVVQEKSPVPVLNVDISKNMSSATDVLALVQASIHSTVTVPTVTSQVSDVLASSHQPRSFGDLPESSMPTSEQNAHRNTVPQSVPSTSLGRQLPPSLLDFLNRPASSEPQNDSWNNGSMQDARASILPDNREVMIQDNNGMHDNRAPFMQDFRGTMMQDNRGPMMHNNRGPMLQDNRGPMMQDNRGQIMQDNRGPMMQDNRGPLMQDNRGPMIQNNRGLPFQDSMRPQTQDSRGMQMIGPGGPNFGTDTNFNRGAHRGNFNNGRMQDKRQMDGKSQYGEHTHFRGRGGRGHFSGGNRRGRGRGYY